DFAYVMEATVTAEAGVACDYDTYGYTGSYIDTGAGIRFLAFSAPYYGIATNVLWSASAKGVPSSWAGIAYDGSGISTISYAAGVLDWTRGYDVYRSSWILEDCRKGHEKGETSSGYHSSSYGSKASMPCAEDTSYER